jgi:long-subunit acyl-CoA synthetase (AMP-forming)
VGTSGAQSLAAINPLTLFQSTVGRHPRAVALALKRPVNGVIPSQWKTWTFQQYWNECVSFAKSLLSLGVAQFDVVNIIGFNSVGASCYVYYHQFCH